MRDLTCFAQTKRLSSPCLLAVGAVILAISEAASAQALQAPITLQGTGPFHRITVPIAIYSHAAFDDLRDVRVRNAAGQAVPFGWLGGEQEATAPRTASTRAPLFAVPASSPNTSTSKDELVGFKLRADGSLTLSTAPTAAAVATAAWVIDASKAEGALVQLRFELAAGSQGMFAFTLEGSDDMRQWRSLGEDKLLVRLQRADQSIERLAVEIEPVRVRFLRLRWRDSVLAPLITGVWLDSVHQEMAPASAIEWSAEVHAAKCGADYCDYSTPRGLPAESLRIALAESNTLAPVRISALLLPSGAITRPSSRNALYVLRHGRPPAERQTASTQELALVDTVVYRLTQSGGEARSPNVALDGNAFDTLRLRTNGPFGALGSSPPTLFFGARPRTLVFLGQGSAPFSLSWSPAGRPVVDVGGALPLTQLLPGYQAGKMPVSDVATVALNMPVAAVAEAVSASTAKSAAASPASAQKWWLWAVLCAGLLLLGAMAWSLFRSFKRGEPPPA